MENIKTIVAFVAVAFCAVSSATAVGGAVLKPFVKAGVEHAVAAQTGKVIAKEVVKDGASTFASSALRMSLKALARPKIIMAAGVAGATMIAAANVSSPEGGAVGMKDGAAVLRYGFASLPYVAVLLGGLLVAGVLRRALKFAAGDRNRRDSSEDRGGDTRLDPPEGTGDDRKKEGQNLQTV